MANCGWENKNQSKKILSSMDFENIVIFAVQKDGGLAQLARAFDWQSKGHRFDSDILHYLKRKSYKIKFVALFFTPISSNKRRLKADNQNAKSM